MIASLAAIWSLMSLTLERAWIISKAGYQGASKFQMKMVILIIWSLSIAFSIPPLVGWNGYVYEVHINCTVIELIHRVFLFRDI